MDVKIGNNEELVYKLGNFLMILSQLKMKTSRINENKNK